MIVKFLKAGNGDSILISHKSNNILVDGGNDFESLKIEIDNLYKKGEYINLLIVTHHDDDHIRGIIELLNLVIKGSYGEDKNFIKQIVFNSPIKIATELEIDKTNLLSFKQARELDRLIPQIDTKWLNVITEESESFIFKDLELEILSPTKHSLQKYATQKGALLKGNTNGDWDKSLFTLARYIDDDSQDTAIPNETSVVILLKNNNKRILLTGDVTPNRFEEILNNLLMKSNEEKIHLDYLKLPHHGSKRSLNSKILNKINCSNYIISTNGKRHYLPNKKALLKVVYAQSHRFKKPIKFYFNYHETKEKIGISLKELKHFNISLIENNSPNGFFIG